MDYVAASVPSDPFPLELETTIHVNVVLFLKFEAPVSIQFLFGAQKKRTG